VLSPVKHFRGDMVGLGSYLRYYFICIFYLYILLDGINIYFVYVSVQQPILMKMFYNFFFFKYHITNNNDFMAIRAFHLHHDNQLLLQYPHCCAVIQNIIDFNIILLYAFLNLLSMMIFKFLLSGFVVD
jgi:hypothetical protein